MSLDEYKQKRKFDETPEPTGGTGDENSLRFVVQKHAASHLHYDFRLELKGVLKSWAVPKGPSLNPEDKRLAMMTEDHPVDYIDFEGIIPKRQYGGGTVIVWDQGTYDTPVIKDEDKKSQEHSVMSQFFKGGILFTLKGQKLKGKFALIKDPERDEKSWYLVKVKDRYATTADVTKKEKSVISGLTIDEMASNTEARRWQSNRSYNKESTTVASSGIDYSILHKGTKAPIPASAHPMNCTLIKEPFNHPDWLYEVKFDGYRIITIKKGATIKMYTRSGLDYSKYYPAVAEALQSFEDDIILDGELVVPDDKGRPNFDLLQKYKGDKPIIYYCFDVLWYKGYDLTGVTLLDRKTLLKQILPEGGILKFSDHFDDGDLLFDQAKEMELEGIVAKRKSSRYEQGKRSKEWLKLPTEMRQEFVIGGWTESDSGRYFRSILFGAYDNGKFKFVGHSGSGFKEAVMKEIFERLKKVEIKDNPFVNQVDYSTTPHWVEPIYVGNFKFSTWTAGGKIRKPAIFLGFRDDKDPKEVVFEVPLSGKEERQLVEEEQITSGVEKIQKRTVKPQSKGNITLSADSNWRELDNQKITSSEVFDIDGKELTLTNVEKELWKGINKANLIQYYHNVAPHILPYLKDRPLSLHIKHIKPTVEGMYIKDMEGRQPEWAELFSVPRKHRKKGKREVIDYLVCNDEATLLYVVNLGCIDINPWTSRVNNYLYPDFIIIDLDPSDEDFRKVIETARAAKQYFDQSKLKAFPKTSGKTGMHLYLPCQGFTFSEARTIAELICKEINTLVPEITTTEVSIAKRGNKLYVDPSQNDEADTVAAPYSVRPFRHPSVSTPLEWKEINEKLDPLKFDINSIIERIEKKGDVFIKVLDTKIAVANSQALKTFL